MTPDCVYQVDEFEKSSEAFEGLTVEQLLYAAIKGSSYHEVYYTLKETDWTQYVD